MELTPGELQEILKVFVDSDLQELHLQVGDVTLAVSKNDAKGLAGFSLQPQARSATWPPIAASVESPAPSTTEAAASGPVEAGAQPQVDRTGLHALRSPSVGVFYRRPGPDDPPYVEVGDVVKVGDPVCTISVMKMFTQVGADRAGRIVEVCVENETLVEHGQVLMYIEPLDEA
jgi:acetyl-CoA carboxylase biotin carboxyl carrier protein